MSSSYRLPTYLDLIRARPVLIVFFIILFIYVTCCGNSSTLSPVQTEGNGKYLMKDVLTKVLMVGE